MAQMAGRASVEYYVGLAIKRRIESSEAKGPPKSEDVGSVKAIVEEAFVIRTFRNGLGVFVSKCVACAAPLFRTLLTLCVQIGHRRFGVVQAGIDNIQC
jgi:hypothetical protein